jgi:hypothetical protein
VCKEGDEKEMKRIKAGRKVLTGQVTTSTYSGNENRLQLFDGKFTTGYRIVDVRIAPDFPSTGEELVGKLTTEPDSSLGSWDFSDVEQLAWFTWGVPLGSRYTESMLIREDNMAVQDLWIQVYNPSEAVTVNYYIVLEKYEFTAWDGAATMVKNLSQSGPA